jgi:hypothetical protein
MSAQKFSHNIKEVAVVDINGFSIKYDPHTAGWRYDVPPDVPPDLSSG